MVAARSYFGNDWLVFPYLDEVSTSHTGLTSRRGNGSDEAGRSAAI